MKRLLLVLMTLLSSTAHAGLADLKFGRAQIADSQWNVQACTQTTTCQIYSKNPGTAYKIPWTSGQIQWSTGDYIAFMDNSHKDANNPWLAVQFGSNGVAKTNMGTGHIINMGNDYFFFVGNDNDTGQLFSMTQGFANSNGVTWTGTLNPTATQVNTYAANGSTTPLAAGQTAAPAGPPPLAGGASASSFNVGAINNAKILTFKNRTTSDTQVYIEQIGNGNTILVDQSGTVNNYTKYQGNGINNDVTVTQTGNSSTLTNYANVNVIGNSNLINLEQRSTGGTKAMFVNVQDNNNILNAQQKDNGNHYLEVSLTGGNKTVNVLQEGSAGHMASISLSGSPVGLSLSQSGGTQQFYSITFNCATSGGCAPISVQQR